MESAVCQQRRLLGGMLTGRARTEKRQEPEARDPAPTTTTQKKAARFTLLFTGNAHFIGHGCDLGRNVPRTAAYAGFG